MKTVVFLTGATGFVGGQTARRLLAREDLGLVVLVRARNREEAEARLSRTWWSWPEAAAAIGGRVEVLAGDVTSAGLGLDPDDEPFFRGTAKLFGVNRVVARINAQTPLPDLGKKFDLVTAHRVCFHRISRKEDGEWLEWKEADWKFFVDDIRTRFLRPDGRLLLEFNRRQDGSSFFTKELREFFVSQGARIARWKALLAADPNERPRFKHI